MKAICALIPAALLAGTVLSGPVDAKGTTDFGAFARDAISKQDYLIVMNARRLGKPKKAGNLKAPKQVAAVRKATKKVLKTVNLKPRKKPAKLAVADSERNTVAASKQDAIEPRKIARLEPVSMSKVLRSGPRDAKNATIVEALPVSGVGEVQIAHSEPVSMSKVLRSGPHELKNVTPGEALPVSEVLTASLDPASMGKVPRGAPREVKDVTPGEALQISGANELLTASLDPAWMSKVPRGDPREVNDVMPGVALQISGASEVLTASLDPASMSKASRGDSREVNDVSPGEALQISGSSEVLTASLDPASMSKVSRADPREVNDVMPGEALLLSDASETETARLETLSMSQVLRSGPREVNIDASEVRIIEVIRETAPYYGVPTWFALRIAEVESGYNPYARGRAGEIGIYQLKCPTARGMGFEGECSDLTNARINVRWGLKHLSLAIALSGGNLKLAASKHNAGLGRKSLVSGYVAKVF